VKVPKDYNESDACITAFAENSYSNNCFHGKDKPVVLAKGPRPNYSQNYGYSWNPFVQ
jgi:hypothetical protein